MTLMCEDTQSTFSTLAGLEIFVTLTTLTFLSTMANLLIHECQTRTKFANLREAFRIKSHKTADLFRSGGVAQPPTIAFGGVFPNITEAILDDENSTPQK